MSFCSENFIFRSERFLYFSKIIRVINFFNLTFILFISFRSEYFAKNLFILRSLSSFLTLATPPFSLFAPGFFEFSPPVISSYFLQIDDMNILIDFLKSAHISFAVIYFEG